MTRANRPPLSERHVVRANLYAPDLTRMRDVSRQELQVTHREYELHGGIGSEHHVQLFDEPDSRVEGVANFLYRGWLGGGPLLVVARPINWALIQARLQARGCPGGGDHRRGPAGRARRGDDAGQLP